MSLPFSVEQFFQVFAAYNVTIWPAQILAYFLALAALALSVRPSRPAGRVVSGILALSWIWMGVVYHILYFSPINPAAFVFGAFFVVQGLLFLVVGSIQGKLTFELSTRPAAIVGAILILYAMVGYPLLGAALGHYYPAAPTFGVTPCPATIFTFGLLLCATAAPRYLLIIPFLWAIVGTSAAIQLGVFQDYGLAIAAVVTVFLMLRRERGRNPRLPQTA